MKKSLSALVSSLYAAMVTDTRTDGTKFLKLAEGSPDWMHDAIRAAHCDMMPDDTRYNMIGECLSKLEDYLDEDAEDFSDLYDRGIDSEIADGLVDIYNFDRLQWLSSSLHRAEYVDESREQGLIGEDTCLFNQIGIGQYAEYQEILQSLMSSILEQYENQEEDE